MYGVIVQSVTNDTGADALERYGEVVDLDALMEDDTRGRDFCDGQTSPLPPSFADDPGGMLYTYDRRTAEYFSGVVRNDLAQRVQDGQLDLSPSWLPLVNLSPLTAATAETVLALETLPATVAEVRQAGAIPMTVTDGQIEAQIRAYVEQTGDSEPTTAALLQWIQGNARWS